MSPTATETSAPLARWLVDRAPAASGSVVMATGIVSTALHFEGSETLSRALLGVALAAWAVLVTVFLARLAVRRSRFLVDAGQMGALTAVAANAVVGTRLALLSRSTAATVLLAIAAVLWLVLLPPAIRHPPRAPTGLDFLLTVSTQSLAVLTSTLAVSHDAGGLVLAAFLLLCLGLLLYPLGCRSFSLAYLRTGGGDMWIAAGALAISAFAGATIASSAAQLGGPEFLLGWTDDLALALWSATMLWLPVLVAAELIWPRLRYDARRWATVFPLGMIAAMSFAVAGVTGIDAVAEDFADRWVWVAFAVWCLAAAGLARRAGRLVRRRAV